MVENPLVASVISPNRFIRRWPAPIDASVAFGAAQVQLSPDATLAEYALLASVPYSGRSMKFG